VFDACIYWMKWGREPYKHIAGIISLQVYKGGASAHYYLIEAQLCSKHIPSQCSKLYMLFRYRPSIGRTSE